MKKNSPGCACCHRVLVWDMGYPRVNSTNGIDWLTSCVPIHTYTVHFKSLQAIDDSFDGSIEEFGDIQIDYATGSPNPPGFGSDPDFYGGPNGPVVEFDPYANAGKDEDAIEGQEFFWTGDINDYSLIIWNSPLAGTDLEPSPSPHSTGCPDTLYCAGPPDWWDDIHKALTADELGGVDNWTGRIVFTTAQTDSDTSFPGGTTFVHAIAQSTYFNSLMENAGVTLRCTVGQDTFAAGNNTVVDLSTEDPLGRYTTEEGEELPIGSIAFFGRVMGVSGGTTVGTRSGIPRIAKESKRDIEIVIVGALNPFSTSGFSNNQITASRRFWNNLIKEPVS